MKRASLFLGAAFAVATCGAQQFSLRDEQGGMTGPFALKDGVLVQIGESRATLAQVRTETSAALERLQGIVIPTIALKEASIRDVTAFLQKAAAAGVVGTNGPNIVLALTPEQESKVPPLTLSANHLSLPDALRLATQLSNLKFRVHGNTVTILPVDAPENTLFTRAFAIMPALTDMAIKRDSEGGQTNQDILTQAFFFAKYGVEWPAGSWVRYCGNIGQLLVRNTPENLALIDQVLTDLGVTPHQVQIDLQFVAYDLTNIARAAQTGISVAALMALWTNGCGELIAAPTVVTKSGQEAVVKGVTEIIYPTDYVTRGGDNAASSNSVATGAAVEPTGFQTREQGCILQVVPEVSAGGKMINLTLSPQIVEKPEWVDVGAMETVSANRLNHIQARQPYFHVLSTCTSVAIISGQRVLIGGGMPAGDGHHLVYLFATATLIDPEGKPIAPRSDVIEGE